ncbi:hypothetical protein SAMN05192574_102357 [Mucilaginibacter gossypiicola]|uniref:Uncharacterized protein n=1 Tax=Mucilaginibacter gossypiicola TaxID=551995 RepID=A0A1H8DIC8_9SPHI|nr:hypothetical protein [Mucilaginibacter gossypiicola]SEN06983.1 hypothetical protein SAMN05192574_102357 [Mucilaginibacter gossypiicola]
MSRLDQVVFFSKSDAIGPHMLGKAERLLNQTMDFSALDLNGLLEFHHIHQYFEHGLYLSYWTEQQIAAYKLVVKEAFVALRKFFLGLTAVDVLAEVGQLSFDNRENFWQLYRYFELYKKHDRSVFTAILAANPIHIRDILSIEKLVDFYNLELRAFLLTYEESAELLLSHYEQKHDRPSPYNFPKSLSDADREAIIEAYLGSAEPNLNYIELAKSARTIKLSPKVRLKAKRVAASITSEVLTDDNSIRMGVAASLSEKQTEPVIFEKDKNGDTIAVYGAAYLNKLQTEQQLFGVFSDLFLYTDDEGLISLVNKDSEMDTLEKIFMQAKNQYQKGILFERKNMLSLAQLGVFSHYLKHSGRSIEALIESFVHTFFKDQTSMAGLVFRMPAPGLEPAEKIRLIAPEMDYLLRQFKNFISDSAIDHELLRMDSGQLHFSELPSSVAKKYIYASHDTIRLLQHWFFDPTSILADRQDDMENRQTVFYRLVNQHVTIADFEDYQLPYLQQMITDGFLRTDEDGKIEIVDPMMVFIAGKLRINGCISYWHISEVFRGTLDRLVDEGFLKVSDRLLTTEEVSYLNYYLNMREFSNGKDLRNKYLHGSHDREPEQQQLDYLYFLRTLIVLLIKLRDDLMLKMNHAN